jgi:hypothetical protein
VIARLAQQRDGKRRTLRRRQHVAVLVEHLAQEIHQARHRGSRLDLGRSRDKDAMAQATCVFEPGAPDGCLHNPGGSFQDQCRGRRPTQEPADGLHLVLASEDLRDGHGFEQVTGSRRSTMRADTIRRA